MSSFTRADVETDLVSRIGAWMVAAGLDGATVDGSNLSLNSAIGWAIRQAGGTVTSPSAVADADVQTVTDYDLLTGLAELRALESVLGNYTAVDKKAGPVELKSSQLGDLIVRRIAQLTQWLRDTYSIGAAWDNTASAVVAHQVAW